MSDPLSLTEKPVQLTDGTNSAHLTVKFGSVAYADSADSLVWHRVNSALNVNKPWVVWVRSAGSADKAEAVVSRLVE